MTCGYSLWPGEVAAYIDIVAGRPRYFMVSGAPRVGAAPLGPVEQGLFEAGVAIIGTGCVASPDSAGYNAVILRHYLESSPR